MRWRRRIPQTRALWPFTLIALFLAVSSPAGAAPPAPSNEGEPSLSTAFSSQEVDWSREAPFRYRWSLPWDGAVVATATAAILAPYALTDRIIAPSCPCDAASVNRFDRSAIGNHSAVADHVSDATAAVALLAPIAFDALDLGADRTFLGDVVVYSETIAVSGALVTLLKYSVQRPLPRVYEAGTDPSVKDPNGYRSFYSGHTTVTFAALTAAVVTYEYRRGFTLWPVLASLVVGSSVGVERILAGRHFPSDVLVGAAAGIAEGVVIPVLHAHRGTHSGVTLLPTPGGLVLSYGGVL